MQYYYFQFENQQNWTLSLSLSFVCVFVCVCVCVSSSDLYPMWGSFMSINTYIRHHPSSFRNLFDCTFRSESSKPSLLSVFSSTTPSTPFTILHFTSVYFWLQHVPCWKQEWPLLVCCSEWTMNRRSCTEWTVSSGVKKKMKQMRTPKSLCLCVC